MAKSFTATDLHLLKKHLQAIAEVEFFTVPFYLNAVYSFTNAALNYSPDKGKTSPLNDLQQKTLSVAVQEMYHLQLACNLANAFDVTPQIPTLTLSAGEVIKIPHLEEKKQPLKTQLGNLPTIIEAMIAVETPDPDHKFPRPNEAVVYPSIADLYHATLTLLRRYLEAFKLKAIALDPHFTPNHNQVAYANFAAQYIYNKIVVRDDVIHSANAITDQGEGNLIAVEVGGPFRASKKEGKVLPEYQPAEGSRFYDYDGDTHYKRFEDIYKALKAKDWAKIIQGAVFYVPNGQKTSDLPVWAPDYPTLQKSLNTIWSYLIDTMQSGFQTGLLDTNYPSDRAHPDLPGFNEAMLTFKYVLPLIWQWGQCPSFVYRAGVTAAEAQEAMDTADPLCLFHWDDPTRKVRTQYPLNACQGLNQCAGQGWGGIGTQKGDGACATADFHTCGGGNSCNYQGGCGFLSQVNKQWLPASEQWIPGENQGQYAGGCQTPIATGQVFDRTAKPTIEKQSDWSPEAKQQLEKLIGGNVWNQARKLFQEREKLKSLPAPLSKKVGDIDYDGTARRKAVQPSSQ